MDAASTATDAVTHAGDLLPGTAPRIQQQLYRAFDLQALYNKNLHQVTIHVTITDSTPPPRRRRHHRRRRRPRRSQHPRPRTASFFGFGTSPYPRVIYHDRANDGSPCPERGGGGAADARQSRVT